MVDEAVTTGTEQGTEASAGQGTESSAPKAGSVLGGSTTETPPASDSQGTGTQTEVKWYEGLPDELKGNQHVQRFTSMDEFVKSSIEARSKLGGMVSIPGENASQEEVDSFYQKLGVPKEAEGYEVDTEIAEGLQIDEDMVKSYQAIAHEAKLTPQQAKALSKWYNEINNKVYQDSISQRDSLMDATVQDLKSEWGSKFDSNLDVTRTVMNKVLSKETIDYLDSSGLGNNKSLITDLFRLASTVGEDSAKGADKKPPEPSNVAAIKTQIDEIMNDKDYWGSPAKQQQARDLLQQQMLLESK